MPDAASSFSTRDECEIGIVTYGGIGDSILLLGGNEDADGRDLEAVQGNRRHCVDFGGSEPQASSKAAGSEE